MRVVEPYRAWFPLLALCFGIPSGGCSDASYSRQDEIEAGVRVEDASVGDATMREASVSDAGPRDGGMPPVTPPTGAELLLGRYAVRVRYHARQPSPGLFKQSEEAILLADIERSGSALQLRMQLCEQHSVSPSTIGADVDARISYPEYVPVRTFTLLLDDDGTFHSEGPPLEIGYGPAPSSCTPGASIAADKPWLPNGRCTCPSDDEPPTSSTDCRVIDSDRDMNPGMTVRFSGLVDRTDFVRRREASQLVRGSIANDRKHTAQYDANVQNRVLACDGSGCGPADFVNCAPGQNRVLFSHLDERASSGFPYTCADVLREVEAGKHFTPDPLTFPSGC